MDTDRCRRFRELHTAITTWITLHDELWRQGLAAELRPETTAITAALHEALVKAQEARAAMDAAIARMRALTRRLDAGR